MFLCMCMVMVFVNACLCLLFLYNIQIKKGQDPNAISAVKSSVYAKRFVDYMARKQEAHEEDESLVPSLTVDKLLKFALDKFTDRSRIDNHTWGSSSKREADFVALSAEVSSLKGNLKLAEKIAKKLKSQGGGGGTPKGKAHAA